MHCVTISDGVYLVLLWRGYKIVEATVDSTWGSGCPFGSDIYEQGQVPGKNVAGEQLTKYKDELIDDLESHRMS